MTTPIMISLSGTQTQHRCGPEEGQVGVWPSLLHTFGNLQTASSILGEMKLQFIQIILIQARHSIIQYYLYPHIFPSNLRSNQAWVPNLKIDLYIFNKVYYIFVRFTAQLRKIIALIGGLLYFKWNLLEHISPSGLFNIQSKL